MVEARIVEGDCLSVLASIDDGTFDAIITDPPYSSGGMFRGDRVRKTDAKYTVSGHRGKRPDFGGDSMDQRSWSAGDCAAPADTCSASPTGDNCRR